MLDGVVSGNGGVDDGVDEMMRTRNHVHDVRCEMLRRSSFPRALVFSPQGPPSPNLVQKKLSSHMELSASTFDLLTRLLSQLPDILLYPIFAPVQYLSSQKQDGKCIYTWVGTKMKCMQCIATNLPLSDGPSPYFVI